MTQDILTYEHVNFNVAANKNKTVNEFIEHESHIGLSEDQLKEAHELIVEAAKENPEVMEAVSEHPTVKGDGGSIAIPGTAKPIKSKKTKVVPASIVVGDSEVHF